MPFCTKHILGLFLFLLTASSVFSQGTILTEGAAAPVRTGEIDNSKVFVMADSQPRWYSCSSITNEKDASACFSQNFVEFLMNHISKSEKIEFTGKVWVEFVVEKNGMVSNTTISKSTNDLLNGKIWDIIRVLPQFIPAKEKGEAVRYQYRIPINISLQ